MIVLGAVPSLPLAVTFVLVLGAVAFTLVITDTPPTDTGGRKP